MPSPMQVLAYRFYLAESLTSLIMYYLSLLTIPYLHIRNIRSLNINFDGTMPSQHLVPVDSPALKESLAVENPALKEVIAPMDNWRIEATLPPTDDTGPEETVLPR